jgi:serine/threonine protein kinase
MVKKIICNDILIIMSQQEIVGEINMDHGQKGGGAGAAVAGVTGVAIILLIRKILYILGLDITQIENGIKKMIINILKNSIRNKITLPIQLQRERMMIVKKAIDAAEKDNKTKEIIKDQRENPTSEFYELEAFLYKVKTGMYNKTGNEKKCKKFFGRPGRLQIKVGEKWKKWDEIENWDEIGGGVSTNEINLTGGGEKLKNQLKIFSDKDLLVKYKEPEPENVKDQSKKEEKSQDNSTPIFYEMIHGILLDYFIEELINNDGDLPIDKGDRPLQKQYIIKNLATSLIISLMKQFKAYAKSMCLNHKSLQINLGRAISKDSKNGGGMTQQGGGLFKKKCNSKKGRPHELFDLLIVLSSAGDGGKEYPIDYNWFNHIKNKEKKEEKVFIDVYKEMKELNKGTNQKTKNEKMNNFANKVFTKLGIATFLKNIITDVCDTLETLNADVILDNMLDNVSDDEKKAYQRGCDGGYETDKDGYFVHRDICDAFFSQSFWNRNFGARIPYLTHSLLQKTINKLGDFQRDGDGKIKCSKGRTAKDQLKDAASEGRRKAAKEKEEEEEKANPEEKSAMTTLMGQLKPPPPPPNLKIIMKNLPKEDENLGKFIDEVLKIKVIVEYLNKLKNTMNCNLKIIDNMVPVKDTKPHDLVEANCTQGPKQKPAAQEEDEKDMKFNIKMAVKIIKSRKIFKALVRELKLNIEDLHNKNLKSLVDKEATKQTDDINALNVFLIIFDILYNQSNIGGIGAFAINRIQAEYKKNVNEVKLTAIKKKELIDITILNTKKEDLPEHTNNHKYLKELFIFLLSNLSSDALSELSEFVTNEKNGISKTTKRKVLESKGKKDKDRQDEFKEEKESKKTDKQIEKEMEKETKRDKKQQKNTEKEQEVEQKKLDKRKWGGGKTPLVFHNTRKLFINLKQIPCYKILNALIKDVLLPIQLTIGDTKTKLLANVPQKDINITEARDATPPATKPTEKNPELYIKPCWTKRELKLKDLWKGKPFIRIDLDPYTYFKGHKGDMDKWFDKATKNPPDDNGKLQEQKDKECKVSEYCFKKKKKSRDSIIKYMEMIHKEQPLYTNYVLSKNKTKKRDKKREEEKAASGGGGSQHGGTLIGQGTYGCVFKPHLLCNGNVDKKDKEHVSKLIVLRREDDYRIKNEMEIGKIILKSKKYSKYFSPIISTCPIEFEHISDQDKYKCNSANRYTNNKMKLAKLKKINGTNLISTLDYIYGQEAISTFLTIYGDALNGLKYLVQKKIIHFDIKWDNVLYDYKLKRGMIIDFGLSFQIKDLNFNSLKELKKYFYIYVPNQDVWCIEIHYICYLLHINDNPNEYDIQHMVEEIVSKNSLFKSYISHFFKFDKIGFYKNCVDILLHWQTQYPDIKNRIKKIVNTFYKTWDNYSLSIMYLKQYDLVLKNTPNKMPTFHEHFIKNILWKNIIPDPNKRLSIKNTIKQFNNLYNKIRPSEFLELAKYA